MDYIRYLNIHSKMILTYPSYFQLPGINENNLKICQKITLYPIQCTWPVYSDFTPPLTGTLSLQAAPPKSP